MQSASVTVARCLSEKGVAGFMAVVVGQKGRNQNGCIEKRCYSPINSTLRCLRFSSISSGMEACNGLPDR
jgi:hypothetical protein